MRGSGTGTRWAAVTRSAVSSRSVSPWREAICSIICCWRMLTSVRCFSSSSIWAGEGWSGRLCTKKHKIKSTFWRGCLSVTLHAHARILHQCDGVKHHTTRGLQQKPQRVVLFKGCAGVPNVVLRAVLSITPRCCGSVSCSRARADRSHTAFWGRRYNSVSHGVFWRSPSLSCVLQRLLKAVSNEPQLWPVCR